MAKQITKVLFVSRKFPPSTGGMENFAYQLSAALQGVADVMIIKWGGSNNALPIVLPIMFVNALLLAVTNKYDVLHAQDGVVATMMRVVSKITRTPYVVVIHGLDITYSNALYQSMVRNALQDAAAIICISKKAAEEVTDRGIAPDKVHVITPGVANNLGAATSKQLARQYMLDNNIATNSEFIVLAAGRLVERKGVLWFVDNVMPELTDKYPNVKLLIAGDGEMKERIIQAVESKKLEPKVTMLGRVDDELLENLYTGADVFVMPNIKVKDDMEGFGLVAIEASAHGTPSVVAGIEGILDATKNGKNAVHVKSQDADEWMMAIGHFIENPEEARLFGENSRLYTQSVYSWDAIAAKYAAVYAAVSNRKR